VQHLPDYNKPPVNEVVLSAQFAPLANLKIVHFGDFWNEIKSEFPITEHKSKLPKQVEGSGMVERSGPQLQIITDAEIPRFWFQNNEQDWLIQVQNDRFIVNWIKKDKTFSYPRYKTVLDTFKKYFKLFRNYAEKNDLGEFLFDQCEVVYINTIISGEGWNQHGEADQIVRVLNLQSEPTVNPEAEDVSLTLRYPLIHDSNQVGRLYVELGPRFRRSANRPGYELRLTARGKPIGEREAGVRKFFDLGHECIVRTFDAITTSKMRAIWERNDG